MLTYNKGALAPLLGMHYCIYMYAPLCRYAYTCVRLYVGEARPCTVIRYALGRAEGLRYIRATYIQAKGLS